MEHCTGIKFILKTKIKESQTAGTVITYPRKLLDLKILFAILMGIDLTVFVISQVHSFSYR